MSNNEMSTTPTIETLLARLNEWGERFTNDLREMKAGQDELRNELLKRLEELRNEFKVGLHRVKRKMEILNDNFLTANADIRELEVRLEKLEAESLTNS